MCTLADLDIANFAWVVPATVFCLIAILVAAHWSPDGSTFKAQLWFCSVEINKDPITGRVGVEVVAPPGPAAYGTEPDGWSPRGHAGAMPDSPGLSCHLLSAARTGMSRPSDRLGSFRMS